MKGKSLSRVRLLATAWTAAYQAPPSMGFSRQKYWSGVPLPSPRLRLAFIASRIQKQQRTLPSSQPGPKLALFSAELGRGPNRALSWKAAGVVVTLAGKCVVAAVTASWSRKMAGRSFKVSSTGLSWVAARFRRPESTKIH